MNNPWAYSIIVMALITMAVSRGLPRAWLWIGIGGASFIASSLYWDFGDQRLHPIFTFACDAMVCVCVHLWAREKWELGVFLAFFTSVFASLLHIGGFMPNNIVYASLLELCNISALLWITGIGLLDRIGKDERSSLHHWVVRLHSARDSLP